ncbi:hypothetical protein GBAR_LOCUS12066 [Geodia barretti]|uniref:Death domain-containing protein n=1 Tax=Geodia barretti TaxID=519541 RepID=A0AA35WG43_GEOBA|nr:hypothetical protein GBAR_LOCUS12066 [Geodia barretti]
MYLLLSKSPPKERHSTGCAERAIRVIRVGKEGGEWNEISTKEFQEMIAEAVPILYEDLRAKGKGMEELENILSDLVVGEGEGEGEEEGEGDGERGRGASTGEKEGKAVIDGVIRKLTRLVGSGKSSRRLLDMELIYLTDTGGQQPFWDLIPIFTRDTTATLFVHRLCEKLDEHPLNDLYQRGKQTSFIAIEGLKEIVFPVNTKTPEEDDKKEASKIRASIEKGATQHKIPIWWFILQLILEALTHKLGRDVLSKDECLHVSKSLGFSERQLDAALAFFDKLNIFLFKKNILPGVVFTNPQVPLDKLSKLVEKQYHLKAAEADPTKAANLAMTGDWQCFRDKGVLTLEFLEEFKSHYVKGIFTPILSMTPESRVNQFLASCTATEIAALVVEFPTGWAPPGVYCCSVCHLQSHAHWEVVHKPPTTPHNKDTPDRQLCQISRNSITFSKCDRPGTVTFIDNFSFFVACVNVDTRKMDREELVEHCQDVRSELFAAVEAGLENTHHTNSRPVPAFLCPVQNESCSTELHTARISKNGKKWICSENSNIFDRLNPGQAVWLSGIDQTAFKRTSSPKMSDLANRVAAIIPGKWVQVAIQLEIGMGAIDAVRRDKRECFEQFTAILDIWERSSSPPFTWNTLVSVLKSPSVNENALARELEREFCCGDVTSHYVPKSSAKKQCVVN